MKTNNVFYRTFTTTFPVEVLRELDRAAKKLKLRKNKILIQAFEVWNKERLARAGQMEEV